VLEPTPPEQGLFWAPWRGLSSASRPCLGLLWDGGNSRPTRMYFASCGFELCLNHEHRTASGSGSCAASATSELEHASATPALAAAILSPGHLQPASENSKQP
jgi:hypothetical protein